MRCPRSFLFSLNLLHKLVTRVLNCFLFLLVFSFAFNDLKAADASVIVASVEGEVFSLSLEDEFQVTLYKSSVGKKIEENILFVNKLMRVFHDPDELALSIDSKLSKGSVHAFLSNGDFFGAKEKLLNYLS